MLNTRLLKTTCVAALLSAPLCGCGKGPKMHTVTGNVSYQGQPIAEGQIIFSATDGNSPAATVFIENGRYSVVTSAGVKTVRISATKETGRIVEGAMGVKYPERIDFIPPNYNTATTLVRTIDPEGELVIDFQLE